MDSFSADPPDPNAPECHHPKSNNEKSENTGKIRKPSKKAIRKTKTVTASAAAAAKKRANKPRETESSQPVEPDNVEICDTMLAAARSGNVSSGEYLGPDEDDSDNMNEEIEATTPPTVVDNFRVHKRPKLETTKRENYKDQIGARDRGRVNHAVKPPTKLKAAHCTYDTAHYKRYNPPKSVQGPFVTFKQYDHFDLYIGSISFDLTKVPNQGVRLDDLSISKVLVCLPAKTLHKCWPADFDSAGMVRATRAPLGLAAKRWVADGELDVDGNAVPEGGAGYYYLWSKGIHVLMGHEGYNAGLYMVRPSFERFCVSEFSFKVSCKAVVQQAEGFVSKETLPS